MRPRIEPTSKATFTDVATVFFSTAALKNGPIRHRFNYTAIAIPPQQHISEDSNTENMTNVHTWTILPA
jgi:hypothetical protein